MLEILLPTGWALEATRHIRENLPAVVPAHFDADAYAGLRHMVGRRRITRQAGLELAPMIGRFDAQRVALAPLLPGAIELFDRVGAHDAFYVVLADVLGCPLLTSDRPLARAVRNEVTVIAP